jgi:hypothetical protein
MATELAWSLPPIQTAARYCSDEATHDANRRIVCADVAGTLLERGNTLIERRIGQRIAQRAGWPAAKLAAIGEESDALMYTLNQHLTFDSETADCATWLAAGRFMGLLAERGELAAARVAVQQGGRPIAELAAAQRAERVAAQREQEAASAAPP